MTVTVDGPENQFRQVVGYATGRLWELGAIEETLAALYDVLDDAVARDEAARSGTAGSAEVSDVVRRCST
jgi:hypothetical protein